MTEDERIDLMADQAQQACGTETARRLFLACITDALVTRVVGPDNPEYLSILKGMSKAAILDVANREADEMTDDERVNLRDAAMDHVQRRVVAAGRHSWVVCEALEADPTTVPPETIAYIAALSTIHSSTLGQAPST